VRFDIVMLVLTLVLPLGAVAADEPKQPEHGGHGDFSDARRWAERFDAPDRVRWQKTDHVLRMLALEEGQRVADIGAGTGYFTVLLAGEVGPTGKVYAVDIEPTMLEYIRQRPELAELHNVETVLAPPDDPTLPDAGVDLILIVNTWHHIEKRGAYLEHLDHALAPDGRLVIIDWAKRDLPMGPPLAEKLSRDQVVDEMRDAGFALRSESVALPYQYFLIFVRAKR